MYHMTIREEKKKNNLYSFWELLGQKGIEIPIIQRDYAQGRKNQKELRNKFLYALKDALEKEKEIRLDFIYGYIENQCFQPLDGQQRLSTLFLLHCYAAFQDRIWKERTKTLEKFSYETRTTSRDFCKGLVANIQEIVLKREDVLSQQIINSAWFFLIWKNDPTIVAMLQTLDDIHRIFYSIPMLWERLVEKKLIRFYYVELKAIGLTDDLYIKMNARGRLLTSFENFKATFEKYIQDEGWDGDLAHEETFKSKIDTVWTDLFWSLIDRNEDGPVGNQMSKAFMNFIAMLAMIGQAIEKPEHRTQEIQKLQQDASKLKPKYFSKKLYARLRKYFNIYHEAVIERRIDLKPSSTLWGIPNDKLLYYLVTKASYTQKVLFFAQVEYLMKVKVTLFDREKYDNWMRVIRNIVARGDLNKSGNQTMIVRSPEAFEGAINLIEELSDGCHDIYPFLSKHQLRSGFANTQMKEERSKAKLILEDNKNEKLRNIIYKLEHLNLFRGRIKFVFDCLDFADGEDLNVSFAEKIYNVVEKYLSGGNISDKIRRALLCTSDNEGNYEYYEYWQSWWGIGQAHKRYLIRTTRELEYYIYATNYGIYIKNLILKLIEMGSVEKLLDSFVPPDDMPNWKKRLIKEPELLNNCNAKYIALPANKDFCYLLQGVRPRTLDKCTKIQ